MFFSRFDFKPYALSRHFTTNNQEDELRPVIPSSRIVAPVRWGIESTIRQAQRQEPDPGTGPARRLFVPRRVRAQVLQWGHSSHLTAHPGIQRMFEFLKRRFWWPEMEKETRAFVMACSVCTRSKNPRQCPQGLLFPSRSTTGHTCLLTSSPVCLSLKASAGHCDRSWTPFFLWGLEGRLQTPWGRSQPLIWRSSPIQRADGESQSGT